MITNPGAISYPAPGSRKYIIITALTANPGRNNPGWPPSGGATGIEKGDMRMKIRRTISISTAYILGRARSKNELKIALKAARDVKTAKKIVNYVVVRP